MVNTFSIWKFRLGILDYLSRNPVFSGNFPSGKTKIDRMHKWQPKKYSFVYVLIRLTSLVCMDKIQKKCCLRVRLVSLISTNKRIHFWPPFMHSVNRLTIYIPTEISGFFR